jgi:STE24 endopeptidase
MRPPPRLRRSRGARIGAIAVAMVIVAEGAVWLLRPGETIEPASVSEGDYFNPAEVERARDYRSGQRALLLVAMGAQGAVLVALALGRPAFARRGLERLARRPALGAAAAGAALSVTVTVVALPASVWAHERSVDVGLSTQSLGPWFVDIAKSTAIGAALAGIGAALLMALVRRFGARWWVPGVGGVVAISAIFSWLAPVVLAPLFNRFEALPEGSRARSDVLELAGRAGVDVGEVYRVDASRRSTALNAYVTGLGPTKRVVIYDTLLEEAERPELRSVVAHELGHVRHEDILRGLAFVALVTPLGLLFTRELVGAFADRTGIDGRSPAALPAYAFALALAGFILSVPGNQLSRKVEASADQFSLETTDDPRALIDLQRQLAKVNISDPDPPGWVEFVFGTHPPATERIGAAVAWEEGERPD